MVPGSFFCAECNKAFTRYSLYVNHVESPEHRKKAAARKEIEQLLDILDAVDAVVAFDDGSSLLDVALERRRRSLGVTRTSNASRVSTEDSDVDEQEKDQGAASNSGYSSGTTFEEESADSDQQSMAEDEVDLSCEYCGIASFLNHEFKVEHLETESHCTRKLQALEQLRGIDGCQPPAPKKPRLAESLYGPEAMWASDCLIRRGCDRDLMGAFGRK